MIIMDPSDMQRHRAGRVVEGETEAHNTGVDQAINADQREGRRGAKQDQRNDCQATTLLETRERRQERAVSVLRSNSFPRFVGRMGWT